MRRTIAMLALGVLIAGCEEEKPQGRFHEPACRIPFINDDFLGEVLHEDWEDRIPGRGTFEVVQEGTGANRDGWLVVTSNDGEPGDISDDNRQAYGAVRIAPSSDFICRVQLDSLPTDPGQVVGLVMGQDEDNLVAVGLRTGSDGSTTIGLAAYSEGSRVDANDPTSFDSDAVMLALARDNDQWIGWVDGTEVGRAEVALERGTSDIGVYVGSEDGSAASTHFDWIDACPYYPDR